MRKQLCRGLLVASLASCVMLVLLGVRSYWYWDDVNLAWQARTHEFSSVQGHIVLMDAGDTGIRGFVHHSMAVASLPPDFVSGNLDFIFPPEACFRFGGFAVNRDQVGTMSSNRTWMVMFPHWCPALLLAALSLACYRWLRVLRARDRLYRGLCGKCGYNLSGNTSGTCPECGERA